MVQGLKDLEYAERLQVLHLPTLCYRRRRNDSIQAYKLLNNIDHMNRETHCMKCQHSRILQPTLLNTTRGHSQKLQVQHAKGSRARYFSTRVTPVWNQLSPTIINSVSINSLKNALLKDHYESSLQYTIF
jgi:hypothetical protein